MSDCQNCKKVNELKAMLSDQRESLDAWDMVATKESTTNRELSQKYYHLKNLFKDLATHANTAIDELEGYDNDSAETIADDVDCLLDEAKANGFYE